MEVLDKYEINRRLENLEGWEYKDDAIHTSFQFENFKEVLLNG